MVEASVVVVDQVVVEVVQVVDVEDLEVHVVVQVDSEETEVALVLAEEVLVAQEEVAEEVAWVW